MIYKITWQPKAEKEFLKMDKFEQKQIQKFIDENVAVKNPKHLGYELGYELTGFWRYDFGMYRIICDIQETECIVFIVKVGNRKDIYKKFRRK